MSNTMSNSLVSGDKYDEDTKPIQDASASEVQSGDEEEEYDIAYAPDHKDRQILNDVDEEETLLAKPSRFDSVKKAFSTNHNPVGRRRRRIERRTTRIKQNAEGSGNTGLIYEMEGGFKDSSSRSSTESLILENQKWNHQPSSRKPLCRLSIIGVGILILFVLLFYGSLTASHSKKPEQQFSNGTHTFGPTTIMISLDGFRADFLQRDLTPTMKAFIESGVSPKYMLPSFPSLTFPNHFTLVTGLYPESHGIVGNQFWDPSLQEEFYYTNVSNSMQPKWWNAEPLWITAEKAGLKTAIHMWPGSEAHINNQDPTYLDKYNGSEALGNKVNRILQWLDMPQAQRPQLIGAYVPNVDADGHRYGPNSTQIRATIIEVDSMLTNLLEGLLERNLTEIVNVVIVSDHGMATTSNDRLVQLDDLIDMSLVDHIDGWPLRGLRLRNPDQDVSILHQQLLAASNSSNFDVYTLDTMPERYHFTKNDRIAPLWVVPHAGWAVVEKVDFDIIEAQSTGRIYRPLGLHGYDHEHPLMRAIFIARGPAFPHPPNSRITAFQNIEVYNIICDSIGIEPYPNNGTLRLPLKTEGLHSDFEEVEPTPLDPVDSTPGSSKSVSASAQTEAASSMDAKATSTEHAISAAASSTPTPDSVEVPASSEKGHSSWWDYLHNQLDKAKEWAKEMVDSIRNNKPSGPQLV